MVRAQPRKVGQLVPIAKELLSEERTVAGAHATVEGLQIAALREALPEMEHDSFTRPKLLEIIGHETMLAIASQAASTRGLPAEKIQKLAAEHKRLVNAAMKIVVDSGNKKAVELIERRADAHLVSLKQGRFTKSARIKQMQKELNLIRKVHLRFAGEGKLRVFEQARVNILSAVREAALELELTGFNAPVVH